MRLPTITNPSCLSIDGETSAIVMADSIYGSPEDIIKGVSFRIFSGNSESTIEYDINAEVSPIAYQVFPMAVTPGSVIGWSITAWNGAGGESVASGINVHADGGFSDTRLFIAHKGAYLSLIQAEDLLETELAVRTGESGDIIRLHELDGIRTGKFNKIIETGNFTAGGRIIQTFSLAGGGGIIMTTSINSSGGVVRTDSMMASGETIRMIGVLESKNIIQTVENNMNEV